MLYVPKLSLEVPDITPVDEFNDKPEGSDPDTNEYVTDPLVSGSDAANE